MALNVTATKQEQFAVAMLQKLKEEKASNLIDYAEKGIVNGANTYNFYRMGESNVGNNTLNMYSDGYTGTGGTAEKKVATIDYVYAHDKIKAIDMNSTSLDLENSYIKSLSDALRRNVDKKILDAVKAGRSNITKFENAVKDIEDPSNVDALIEYAVYASTNVKSTSVSEGRTGVALVVDTAQYARLFRAEKMTNNNWVLSNKFTSGQLFGCDVVKVASSTKDKDVIYLIPAGTIGIASFENDIDAKAWWDDGQDALFCRVKRSLGVVLLEPESIVEIKHKAIAVRVGG